MSFNSNSAHVYLTAVKTCDTFINKPWPSFFFIRFTDVVAAIVYSRRWCCWNTIKRNLNIGAMVMMTIVGHHVADGIAVTIIPTAIHSPVMQKARIWNGYCRLYWLNTKTPAEFGFDEGWGIDVKILSIHGNLFFFCFGWFLGNCEFNAVANRVYVWSYCLWMSWKKPKTNILAKPNRQMGDIFLDVYIYNQVYYVLLSRFLPGIYGISWMNTFSSYHFILRSWNAINFGIIGLIYPYHPHRNLYNAGQHH